MIMEGYPPEILQSLLAFFHCFEAEASGHDGKGPDPQTIAEMDLFLKKELPKEDWDSFFARMATHPDWLRQLAERLGAGPGSLSENEPSAATGESVEGLGPVE
jgi:hypothetical protein